MVALGLARVWREELRSVLPRPRHAATIIRPQVAEALFFHPNHHFAMAP